MSDLTAFETTIQEPKKCPNCGQRTLVELLFGMPVPDPDLFDAVERGDVVLGGCCLSATLACDSPDLTCTTCNWTGLELYSQLFEENDLVGVMNAHAQHGSELFLQGAGLAFFVNDASGAEVPPGWAEMLTTIEGAYGELVQHAATVLQAADATAVFADEFDDSLVEHAELRFHSERCLESMRQQLAGLALAVIAAHAAADDATAVEMADRAAGGVLHQHQENAAAAVEMVHARTADALRVELAGKVCGLVMMHSSVMTLTNHNGAHVHFGWRSDPLGDWALALWQDGNEPVYTWDDPLQATEVVDEIVQRLALDTEQSLTHIKVQPLTSLFARR